MVSHSSCINKFPFNCFSGYFSRVELSSSSLCILYSVIYHIQLHWRHIFACSCQTHSVLIINEFHFPTSYGFFSMIIFGIVYHILLKSREGNWYSSQKLSLWTSAFGVFAILLAYLIGGLTHIVLHSSHRLNGLLSNR